MEDLKQKREATVSELSAKLAAKDAVLREFQLQEMRIQEISQAAFDRRSAELVLLLQQNDTLSNFLFLADGLSKEEEGFTSSVRDRIMEHLESMADSSWIKEQDRFSRALRDVIRKFAQANLVSQIDRIDDMYAQVILKDDFMVR